MKASIDQRIINSPYEAPRHYEMAFHAIHELPGDD